MTDLRAGTVLGHYEILGPLGAGGMGAVFRARDTRLERDVALKFLTGAGGSDVARLLPEAKAASALNHPNICTVHEVVDGDGHAFIDRAERPVTDFGTRRGNPGARSLATDGRALYFTWEEGLGDIWVMDVEWE